MFTKKKDMTASNLDKLITLYTEYRQMQYDIFKQYNLLLEDPQFDVLYIDISPLTHFRGYIENDMNGSDNHPSTTDIIKEFKKLRDTYLSILASYNSKTREGDTLIN